MDLKELNIFSRSRDGLRHPWETVRLEMIKLLVGSILDSLTTDDCLLDIGCGDAYTIQNFASQWPDLKYIGVDSAFNEKYIENIRANASGKTGISLHTNLSDVQNFKAIKMVFLLDVLEHVKDDQSFISEISRQLNSDTHILITVPAFQSLYCRHDKWLEHYRRYTKAQMMDRIKNAGLHPIASGYFFSSLLIPRLIAKGIEKMSIMQTNTKDPSGIGQWKYGEFPRKIVCCCLYLNGYIDIILSKFGITIPGLSLYILCKK